MSIRPWRAGGQLTGQEPITPGGHPKTAAGADAYGFAAGSLRSPPEQRLEMRPEPFGDDSLAFGGRMDAIGLVQPGLARHAVQEKRSQRDARRPRDLGKD